MNIENSNYILNNTYDNIRNSKKFLDTSYNDILKVNQAKLNNIRNKSNFSSFINLEIQTQPNNSSSQYLNIYEGPSLNFNNFSNSSISNEQLLLINSQTIDNDTNSNLYSNEYKDLSSIINSIINKSENTDQDSSQSSSNTSNRLDLSPSKVNYTNGSKDVFDTTKPKPSSAEIEKWVKEASKKYGMEPSLVMGIIKAESSFNNQCISRSGAVGLMQLMPETAREMGLKVNDTIDERWDPQKNVEAGVAYISKYHKIISNKLGKDDWSLTLAGYNCGPNRVIREGGIPNITETKNYVKKVEQYWKEYKAKGY